MTWIKRWTCSPGWPAGGWVADPGYRAVQTIPGIGTVLAAVFVAEVTHVHRGRITKQGCKLVRWAAIESVKQVGPHTDVGRLRERVAARRGNRNIGSVAAARRQIEHVHYALRDGHVRGRGRPSPSVRVRPDRARTGRTHP